MELVEWIVVDGVSGGVVEEWWMDGVSGVVDGDGVSEVGGVSE